MAEMSGSSGSAGRQQPIVPPPLQKPHVQSGLQVWIPLPQAPQSMVSPGVHAPSPEQVDGHWQLGSQVTVPQ
jgi:hypothetical protein